MRKADRYRQILKTLEDWDDFLLQESNLPGPRANLELVQAVADEGDETLSDDKDVLWIMRQNLRKKRLSRLDSAWVECWQQRLAGPRPRTSSGVS